MAVSYTTNKTMTVAVTSTAVIAVPKDAQSLVIINNDAAEPLYIAFDEAATTSKAHIPKGGAGLTWGSKFGDLPIDTVRGKTINGIGANALTSTVVVLCASGLGR